MPYEISFYHVVIAEQYDHDTRVIALVKTLQQVTALVKANHPGCLVFLTANERYICEVTAYVMPADYVYNFEPFFDDKRVIAQYAIYDKRYRWVSDDVDPQRQTPVTYQNKIIGYTNFHRDAGRMWFAHLHEIGDGQFGDAVPGDDDSTVEDSAYWQAQIHPATGIYYVNQQSEIDMESDDHE